MINNESPPKSQLSTDLEILHAKVKGKSLTFAELKQALKGRGPAMLLILLARLRGFAAQKIIFVT